MSTFHDLVLERIVGVPASHLWRGWTEQELLMKWFTPAPWQTVHADIDPVPGGVFHTVMRGPDGDTNEGADSHAEMGFEAGWGAALDQLVALAL